MSASQSDAPSEIHLLVNGENQTVAAPCSVLQLLELLGMSPEARATDAATGTADSLPPPRKTRVAVAVNRDVVQRSRYAEVSLAEGDHVEILEAVGGG